MNTIKKILISGLSIAFVLTLTACAPEVGSDKWCAKMKEKGKGELTGNEISDFAKNCVFK